MRATSVRLLVFVLLFTPQASLAEPSASDPPAEIAEMLPLLDSSGRPVMGPAGVLMVPIQKDEHGRPILDAQRNPQRIRIKTNDTGQPLLGADGQPIPSTSDEEPKEAITPIEGAPGPYPIYFTIVVIAAIGAVFLVVHTVRRWAFDR